MFHIGMCGSDMAVTPKLLEVGADDIDEFGRAFGPLLSREYLGGDVFVDMVFEHLGHQAIEGTAHASDSLHYVAAFFFFFERPLNRLHLSPNTAHSI